MTSRVGPASSVLNAEGPASSQKPRTISPRVLTPADFTYLGTAGIPRAGEGGTYFSYSNGRLAGRVVSGEIRLFLTQANPSVDKCHDDVAELKYNGVGNPCTLVTNWGDITKGQRVTAGGGALPLGGLFWDVVTNQLWWTYGQVYAGNNVYNPSIGTSALAGSGNSGVVAYGPWRLGPEHSQKTRGYMYALPDDIQAALRGKRLAVGSPATAGNSTSAFGAYADAFAPPPINTRPSSVGNANDVAIRCTNLIFSDIDHRQPRVGDTDSCGWAHYGETDRLGAQPQLNPTQNGSGCTVNGQLCGTARGGPQTSWTSLDILSAATGIYGPNKSGIVYIGGICRTLPGYTYAGNGRNHITYGPTQAPERHLCVHGQNHYQYCQSTGDSTQTMMSALYIYDPADLLAVAERRKSSTLLPPTTDCYDMSQLSSPSGVRFPQLAQSIYAYGGCWFEPTNKLLFVSDIARDAGLPLIHVLSVNC